MVFKLKGRLIGLDYEDLKNKWLCCTENNGKSFWEAYRMIPMGRDDGELKFELSKLNLTGEEQHYLNYSFERVVALILHNPQKWKVLDYKPVLIPR